MNNTFLHTTPPLSQKQMVPNDCFEVIFHQHSAYTYIHSYIKLRYQKFPQWDA